MAIPHKNFDAEAEFTPSCSFQLGGRTWHCRESEELSFGFIESVRAAADAKSGDDALVQVQPFFEGVLLPDEVADFTAMLHDPGSRLTLKRIGDIMHYVTEKVLNRPTKRPSTSRGGSSTTKGSSRAASPSRVTQRKTSVA